MAQKDENRIKQLNLKQKVNARKDTTRAIIFSIKKARNKYLK
jgi:hypothetical protein